MTRRRGLRRAAVLVIAGYDANPIDGVQGAKTQSALSKFLSDRKLPADTATGPDFFGTLLARAKPFRRRLLLVQTTPKYTVMASLGMSRWALSSPAAGTGGSRQCVRPDVRGDPRKL